MLYRNITYKHFSIDVQKRFAINMIKGIFKFNDDDKLEDNTNLLHKLSNAFIAIQDLHELYGSGDLVKQVSILLCSSNF